MRPEDIHEFLRRQPFEPFRLFLSDGSSYEVRHPEMAWVTQRRVYVGIDKSNNELPLDTAVCDPLHVTRIEPINGHSS